MDLVDPQKVEKWKGVSFDVMSSCRKLFRDMSNAVVGTVADMYDDRHLDDEEDADKTVRLLLKDNRHMYIALTFILVLTLYLIFFHV